MLHFAQLDDLNYSTVYKHFVPTALLMPPLPESLYPLVPAPHPNAPAKENSLRSRLVINTRRDQARHERLSQRRQHWPTGFVRFGESVGSLLNATRRSKRCA